MMPRAPSALFFPYTTLFRSLANGERKRSDGRAGRWNISPFSLGPSVTCTCEARISTALGENSGPPGSPRLRRSEEHTSELQSLRHIVCRLLLEKKKTHQRVV